MELRDYAIIGVMEFSENDEVVEIETFAPSLI